jgi:CRISP-associated protein Cas1
MRLDDLHLLPKVRHSGSFLYLQRGKLEQDGRSVVYVTVNGRVAVPIASLSLLMLGPGMTVTHRAIVNAAECGCSVVWAGEEGVRLYAAGLGDSRSARRVLNQVHWLADDERRLEVVRRMYAMRFDELLDPGLTLRQIRGMEGARVRETYRQWAEDTGVAWRGRDYRRDDWAAATPINRALSAANACLYGIAHAAIVSAGYSPALGFVHTGKALSFVYDVADLYKTETSIPAAFRAVQSAAPDPERAARHQLRDHFHRSRLLGRIVDDLHRLFEGAAEETVEGGEDEPELLRNDVARPGALWDPAGPVEGGVNYGETLGGIDADLG